MRRRPRRSAGRSFITGAIQRLSLHCVRARARKQRSDDGHGAVQNRRPADVAENRRADDPDVMPGPVERRRVGQPSDDVVPDELTHDQHEQPDEDEREADVPQCLSPPTRRKIDRQPEHDENEDEQPEAQEPDDLDALLSQAELVGAHDRHRSGGRRQLGDRVRRADRRSFASSVDELVQVERDVLRFPCRCRSPSCSRARSRASGARLCSS